MSFDHSARSDWLRSVQAARPPNVKVIGQSFADDLQAVATVHELRHLEAPVRHVQFALWRSEVAGAQPERLEVRAVRPFWLQWMRVNAAAGAVVSQIDAHVLATADQTPETFGEENTTVRFRVGKVAGAAGEGILIPAADTLIRVEMFIPLGRILAFVATGPGGGMLVSLLGREVPDPRTVP